MRDCSKVNASDCPLSLHAHPRGVNAASPGAGTRTSPRTQEVVTIPPGVETGRPPKHLNLGWASPGWCPNPLPRPQPPKPHPHLERGHVQKRGLHGPNWPPIPNEHEFPHRATPNQDTDIEHMFLNPNTMNPLPTVLGLIPPGELHSRKVNEATPTQLKLHTQPHSKHLALRHHHTARCEGKAVAPCNASPAPAHRRNRADTIKHRAHNKTPTPHQDGTNSPDKRSPASGKNLGPDSPSTTQTHHITATATIAKNHHSYL
ncbi:hypothetical protein CRENBAI_021398 [Crenichthys baileyi]|uniref:Uncharacterized protein n=1 Tax=Crenichthys baileyi TaxID=28760 RepID=A0AAV9SH69_9TELE